MKKFQVLAVMFNFTMFTIAHFVEHNLELLVFWGTNERYS